MLKHFFARSSSTSAAVKKNEQRKNGIFSPPILEPTFAAQKGTAFEAKNEINKVDSEKLLDKPATVTAYGYEDSSYEDGRRPLDDFTDSPKEANKGNGLKDNSFFQHGSAKLLTNIDARSNANKIARNNDSPNFNESSIAPADISLTQMND